MKELFHKYQRVLLWLANCRFGEFIFCFRRYGLNLIDGLAIVKISPNSVAQVIGYTLDKHPLLQEHFFSRPEYYLRIKFWLELFTPFKLPGWKLDLALGLTTTTFNPNASVETTSTDGWAGYG